MMASCYSLPTILDTADFRLAVKLSATYASSERFTLSRHFCLSHYIRLSPPFFITYIFFTAFNLLLYICVCTCLLHKNPILANAPLRTLRQLARHTHLLYKMCNYTIKKACSLNIPTTPQVASK